MFAYDLKGLRGQDDVYDDMNTGKFTRLLLWQVQTVLDEFRGRPLTGRGIRVRHGLGWALAHETAVAVSGDFCYTFARRLRQPATGAV